MKRSLLIVASAFLIFGASSAHAQSDAQKDVPRLQWRFDSLLKAKSPQAVDPITKGIAEERSAIHAEFEKEIAKTIKELEQNQSEPADLVLALDRQRSIVASINQRIDETKADLSLLEREEGYYEQLQKTGTGAPEPDQIMLTKSYPELLAKKAILEERRGVLQAFLNTQNDRLNQLKTEQQVRNLGTLWGILTSLGVILIIFWAERFIRTALLSHIRHRRLRYVLTKTFSFVVYISFIFWFVQKIFSEHPEILTVVALVGAALVIVTQDVIKGMLGWFGLKNALGLGQRVSIGPLTGDVIDIGFLYTTLLISRTTNMEDVEQVGKLVRIPNYRLLSDHVVNYHSTSDFENVEFPVRIALPAQAEEAQRILEEILSKETDGFAQRAQRQTDQRMRGYYYTHAAPSWRVHTELVDGREVQFLLCFPAPIGQRRAISSIIIKELLLRFSQAGIRLAECEESKQ